MRKALWLLLLLTAISIGGLTWLSRETPPPPPENTTVPVETLLADTSEEFAQVDEPWQFQFPADHGAHPNFRTESWYFTGNLATAQGRHFGFQLTFFRLALTPEPPQSRSAWSAHQVYRSHFAVTDVATAQFFAFERFSRAALGLSGAQETPVTIWLENWVMKAPGVNGDPSVFHLQAAENDIRIDLNLTSSKPAVLADNSGLFANGTGPGNAFYFYWLPRLTVQGTLQIKSEPFSVTGLAWLDRAWGDVSLTRGQLALNRFALQLNDGREILCFQLHRRDGSGIPITTALLVSRDGTTQSFGRRELSLETLDYWTSSHDASRYPARWQLHIPDAELELTIIPYLADQEMNFAIRYWGGAVRVSGQANGRSLRGSGYVELTGYGEHQAPR